MKGGIGRGGTYLLLKQIQPHGAGSFCVAFASRQRTASAYITALAYMGSRGDIAATGQPHSRRGLASALIHAYV
jgi:hypothetical protein